MQRKARGGVNTKRINPCAQRRDAPCRPSPYGFVPESRDAALLNPVDTHRYRPERAPCLAAFWGERDPFPYSDRLLGFETASSRYLEDGIPHQEMRLPA